MEYITIKNAKGAEQVIHELGEKVKDLDRIYGLRPIEILVQIIGDYDVIDKLKTYADESPSCDEAHCELLEYGVVLLTFRMVM